MLLRAASGSGGFTVAVAQALSSSADETAKKIERRMSLPPNVLHRRNDRQMKDDGRHAPYDQRRIGD
jgi:hypothetical protein